MPTDPTEDRKSHKTCLLVMAGLPTTECTLTNPPSEKGEILQFLWKMKIENYSEETIERYGRALETLVKRGAELSNPESVKLVIATQKWSDETKQNTDFLSLKEELC